MTFRHAAAVAVRDAVLGYWGYLAAAQVLQVRLSTEARAQAMVEDVRTLVEAEERPAADLNQLLASLAAKRASRIMAEQAVVDARRTVGLSMGMDPDRILALPPPATPFPEAEPFAPNSAKVREWTTMALRQRADLMAQHEQERAADELVRGARSELRPNLQLSAALGYRNVLRRAGFQAFVDPLHERIPGMDASLELGYSFPSADAETRGRVLQLEARLEQEHVTAEDLERRIVSAVQIAADALHRSLQALDQ
ncbi:MAG: TolC family protein, partial [Gammaproteobacteria bacterium]|nr:TolC family protein [Gammaproteobacteria bacterium]